MEDEDEIIQKITAERARSRTWLCAFSRDLCFKLNKYIFFVMSQRYLLVYFYLPGRLVHFYDKYFIEFNLFSCATGY